MSLFRGDSWRLEHTGQRAWKCKACWIEGTALVLAMLAVSFGGVLLSKR
jgi:hypothetical protein